MQSLDEYFDADDILREPDDMTFDDIEPEEEASELDFNDNKSIDNLDIEEPDELYS
jgi:hypothetical protein